MTAWPAYAPYPFTVIIPARCASTRLPDKPLLDIAGKSMLEWVYRQAQASGAQRVLVAAGDDAVKDCAKNFGAEVQATQPDHSNGTARIAEVAAGLSCDADSIIVNVQGDEPMIAPEAIAQVARNLYKRPEAFAATLCTPLLEGEFRAVNVVKVWCDEHEMALGFARQPREVDEMSCNRHLGIYAYRARGLLDYAALEPAPGEVSESLEQLRMMYHQLPVYVGRIAPENQKHAGIGVDTPEDLERVRRLMGDRSP